jgi:predicted nuclease with TOPRIM domain
VLSTFRDNLEGLYKDAVSDLATLQNSHNLTMPKLDKRRSELSLLQESVDELHESLSSKDSKIKELQALSRSQAKKVEVLEYNIDVLKNECKLLKASLDKVVDKVILVGRLLMTKPDIIVPEDIVTDVVSEPSVKARIPPSDSRSASTAEQSCLILKPKLVMNF